MIEKIIIEYLSTELSVDVVMEIPSDPPEKYVLVEKTGGGERDFIKSSTVAVQSYADSLAEAAELNETVNTAMRGLPGCPHVAGCALNSSYNFTDTAQKKYRYQSVWNITHK